MSASKAHKLADGSRKNGTIQGESDFSVDNDFSWSKVKSIRIAVAYPRLWRWAEVSPAVGLTIS